MIFQGGSKTNCNCVCSACYVGVKQLERQKLASSWSIPKYAIIFLQDMQH